jgi:hypothetical protein
MNLLCIWSTSGGKIVIFSVKMDKNGGKVENIWV